MNEQTTANNLLPFPVLVSAMGGDIEAINAVLKHYEGYIAVLSTRQLYDEQGNPHLCVDDGLRSCIQHNKKVVKSHHGGDFHGKIRIYTNKLSK